MTGRAPQVPFTAEEDARIVEMYTAGETQSRIGAALGRTSGSVHTRIVRLKLKRGDGVSRAGFRWSDEELKVLQAHRGAPIDVLMEKLPGRGPHGINKQLKDMGEDEAPAATGRPIGVPYQTSSGAWAIRLGTGIVPYVPTLYGRP